MAKKLATPVPDASYERHRAAMAVKSRERSARGRDIADIPDPADPARRLAASADLRLFCETYFAQTFRLAWSDDHLTVIRHMQDVALTGGMVAVAMPRGFGKTQLVKATTLWALLNGHREFACLIGASVKLAGRLLAGLKTWLEAAGDLAADYPEVCVPIRRLERTASRCKGQTYRGEPTRMEWMKEGFVLPTIVPKGWKRRPKLRRFVREDGTSLAAGGVVMVLGIEGGIRGLEYTRHDGRTVRPDLVVPDDPSTDESARSLTQNEFRRDVIMGTVLGLSGPDVEISAIMPCTVIAPDDMADEFLDRTRHPEWNGLRTKMLYAFPDRMDLWERYREIRADGFRAGDKGAAATEFYRDNREEMDRGARVAWPAKHRPGELSALQHAMNLYFRSEAAFMAECQNDPLRQSTGEAIELTADLIGAKINRHERSLVPAWCNRLTAFVDIQGKLLYWVACGWGDGFSGAVVDYGTIPDQKRPYFSLSDAKRTLAMEYPGGGLESSIYAGLETLGELLCGREWRQDGGGSIRLARLLVDANWHESTKAVYQFARQSKYAATITPSVGKGIGVNDKPMSSWSRKEGDRVGDEWRIANAAKRAVRSVLYDTNYWKTFTAQRLLTPMGDKGCLSLFGDRPGDHRLFCDHLTAETREQAEAKSSGRKVDLWRLKPNRDNHWWDGLVGCAVAASIDGATLLGEARPVEKKRREKVSFAELQQRRRAGR